jgi:hypothetical protein
LTPQQLRIQRHPTLLLFLSTNGSVQCCRQVGSTATASYCLPRTRTRITQRLAAQQHLKQSHQQGSSPVQATQTTAYHELVLLITAAAAAAAVCASTVAKQ